MFARVVLGLSPHDLTGGFKAWRATTLEAIDWGRVHSGGYVFQIETTYLASRAGARVVEVPIVFKDREVGTQQDVQVDHPRGARGGPAAALGRAARTRSAARLSAVLPKSAVRVRLGVPSASHRGRGRATEETARP